MNYFCSEGQTDSGRHDEAMPEPGQGWFGTLQDVPCCWPTPQECKALPTRQELTTATSTLPT